MDPTVQLYRHEATGWRAGVYDDIERTFRAPVVNSVWRVPMAHNPELFADVWTRLKPVFETRRFAAFSVAYRDTVCSGVEAASDGPLGVATLGITPEAATELRGQLATFDVVAPRLAVAFELCDRLLNGGDVATDSTSSRAATAPFPEWLDTNRGRRVTLAGMATAADAAPETVAAVRDHHALGPMLPSIHRCLAQWPTAFEALWDRVKPAFASGRYRAAVDAADGLVDAFVRGLPVAPALTPTELATAGFDSAVVDALGDHFVAFNDGAGSVLPTLHAYALAVGAVGERTALTFDR